MEPVYRNIEFCRSKETLWGKMREGRWDWLGVHKNGQFVLGSPPISRIIVRGAVTVSIAESVAGEHGLRLYADPQHPASESWFRTADATQEKFLEILADYEGREGPFLVLVERIEDYGLVEKRWIMKNPSTYDWRPPPTQ